MLKDMDPVEAAEKYRSLSLMVNAVERMPVHIKKCKFSAPPVIPAEFKRTKIPSNLFFTSYEFTMLDILEGTKQLMKLYEPHIQRDVLEKIKKEVK